MQHHPSTFGRVRLLYSPFHELLASLHVLVYPTPRYTFALPWVMRTRPALPSALRKQIDEYATISNLWFWSGILLRPGVDPTASVPQILQTLRELPLAAFLRHFAGRHLPDEPGIQAWLDGGAQPDAERFQPTSPEDRQIWRRLIEDPAAERERVLEVIETYWSTVYQGELRLREPVIMREIERLAHLLHDMQNEERFLERVFDRVRFDWGQGELVIHKQSEMQRFPWDTTEAVCLFPSTFVAPHLVSGGMYNKVSLSVGISYLAEPSTEPPDEAIKALADGTRLRIYRRLLEREATTQDLAREFGLAEPTVSRHLQKLKGQGLVSSRKEVQYMYYLGNPLALEATLENLRRYLLQNVRKEGE